MLKGIPKILSPEILKILSEMGHGDELVIADANFPSASFGNKVVRADGCTGEEMLKAVISLLPLDQYEAKNMFLMDLTGNDKEKPLIWNRYKEIVAMEEKDVRIAWLTRYEFYERTKQAYAVLATGEETSYANVILKKGVIFQNKEKAE